jgi:hypothetical protein
MRRFALAVAVTLAAVFASGASAGGWTSSVPFTNRVASSPVAGGGYPVAPGEVAPTPGTCRLGDYNSNRSESWIAVQPGTENLVGVSKFFFENFSTFYDFHLGSYTIPNGVPSGNAQVTGYDCISTGTQDMPPSWTSNTDPNVDFDSAGRAYQVTLPFNSYWVNLHPNGAIGVVYSDDLGRTWTVGNGGRLLDHLSNSSSLSFGDVVDKQWVAVNHASVSPYRDHVYAMWSIFNGQNGSEIWFSKSVDRGQTFSAPVRITPPNVLGPANTYVYPSVDAAGNLYVSVASFKASGSTDAELWVAKSTDDGGTFNWFDTGARAVGTPGDDFPNTTFRDGILENFTASPTYPGHLYLTYEAWDGTQMDVKFTQSTNGGASWSSPVVVNDNADSSTDQFQPSVAAGVGGAVAVAFYDRRQACPSDKSVRPADVGRTNFCIDVSLQPYKDAGGGAVAVGGNRRISQFTWDPMEPDQHVGGLGQMACAAHEDPCLERAFIGDYFGLAISAGNVYAFSVSTHYPSKVKADEGGFVYYQQQVLATVPRSGIGAGY